MDLIEEEEDTNEVKTPQEVMYCVLRMLLFVCDAAVYGNGMREEVMDGLKYWLSKITDDVTRSERIIALFRRNENKDKLPWVELNTLHGMCKEVLDLYVAPTASLVDDHSLELEKNDKKRSRTSSDSESTITADSVKVHRVGDILAGMIPPSNAPPMHGMGSALAVPMPGGPTGPGDNTTSVTDRKKEKKKLKQKAGRVMSKPSRLGKHHDLRVAKMRDGKDVLVMTVGPRWDIGYHMETGRLMFRARGGQQPRSGRPYRWYQLPRVVESDGVSPNRAYDVSVWDRIRELMTRVHQRTGAGTRRTTDFNLAIGLLQCVDFSLKDYMYSKVSNDFVDLLTELNKHGLTCYPDSEDSKAKVLHEPGESFTQAQRALEQSRHDRLLARVPLLEYMVNSNTITNL